jgi:hypothetical protein
MASLLIMFVDNFMDQSPCWDYDSRSAGQELERPLSRPFKTLHNVMFSVCTGILIFSPWLFNFELNKNNFQTQFFLILLPAWRSIFQCTVLAGWSHPLVLNYRRDEAEVTSINTW